MVDALVNGSENVKSGAGNSRLVLLLLLVFLRRSNCETPKPWNLSHALPPIRSHSTSKPNPAMLLPALEDAFLLIFLCYRWRWWKCQPQLKWFRREWWWWWRFEKKKKELRKCSIIENVGILCLINRDFIISHPILNANPIQRVFYRITFIMRFIRFPNI